MYQSIGYPRHEIAISCLKGRLPAIDEPIHTRPCVFALGIVQLQLFTKETVALVLGELAQ